MAAPQFDKRMT
jgi:tubulin polyglutamylase TTLL4